jgi:two-component system, NarL family, response regulator NreC
VIVLSMHADEAYVIQALGNGASGYVLKDSKVSDLVQAINAVLEGGFYLSPPLSERALDSYVQAAQSVTSDPYQNLTAREREVFNLVAEGNTSGEIAETLSISSRTVEVHRANMMRKLNLHTPTELIRFAIKKGILPPDAQV